MRNWRSNSPNVWSLKIISCYNTIFNPFCHEEIFGGRFYWNRNDDQQFSIVTGNTASFLTSLTKQNQCDGTISLLDLQGLTLLNQGVYRLLKKKITEFFLAVKPFLLQFFARHHLLHFLYDYVGGGSWFRGAPAYENSALSPRD